MSTTTQSEIHAFVEGLTARLSFSTGAEETITADSDRELKQRITRRTVEAANEWGADVRLTSSSEEGVVSLIVGVDGQLKEDTRDPLKDRIGIPPMPIAHAAITETVEQVERQDTATSTSEELPTRRQQRASFLTQENQTLPAEDGWRGALRRTTGIAIAPSPTELTRREHVRLVSQHWAGPRKIGVVNGKGGVGKTMTTASLAAVFARFGGAGVLAWDNNDTRGTLGWRTEQGPHEATVQDLLTATDRLLAPNAQMSELARFVHHQTADKYEVLRSNPQLLAAKQRIEREEFDALHEVAAKYFRMVFFDSGNDESADRWLGMIEHTDQLVVPTTSAGEHAESAALLLDALRERDERSAQLADNAVVIVSQPERGTPISEVDRVAEGFAGLARAVVTIPFDPALKSGPLRFEAMAKTTQNAWLAAGAAIAKGL